MPLVLNGATSGATTLQATDATTQTITLPANSGTVITTASTGGVSQAMLASGVAGNGPVLIASTGNNITITSSTSTTLIGSASWSVATDTSSAFNTSTGRFTPQVAGYYIASVGVQYGVSGITASVVSAVVQKNGISPVAINATSASAGYPLPEATGIVYLNGSTDYLQAGTAQNSGATYTQIGIFNFHVSLLRAA